MSDLISRQAAVEAVAEHDPTNGYDIHFSGREVQKILLALPSAEPVHGEWILSDVQRKEDTDNDNYWYVCSECGHSDLHSKSQEVPYCWWCGARMVGEEHEPTMEEFMFGQDLGNPEDGSL